MCITGIFYEVWAERALKTDLSLSEYTQTYRSLMVKSDKEVYFIIGSLPYRGNIKKRDLFIKRRVKRVEVFIVKAILCKAYSLAETLEVDYLSRSQKADGILYVGIVGQP